MILGHSDWREFTRRFIGSEVSSIHEIVLLQGLKHGLLCLQEEVFWKTIRMPKFRPRL